MTKSIAHRKDKLIQKIVAINSEAEIDEIEKSIQLVKLKATHRDVFKPMRKTITVDELVKQQNFKGIDRARFDKLVEALDIQEPIEKLLAMLD